MAVLVNFGGVHMMRRLSVSSIHIAAILASLAAIGAASVCHAGDIDKTGHPSVTLKVAGDIAQTCGLGAIPSASLGDLSKPTITADADLGLQCNVPFDLVVMSRNGGLRNIAHPDGFGPYAGVRGYQMTVAMPVQKPAQQIITAQYSAHELRDGKAISSDGGIAFNGAHIHLCLDDLASPGLAAGDYSETIEFTISPEI